jgi:S-formylglutathione hydrolase FrmB
MPFIDLQHARRCWLVRILLLWIILARQPVWSQGSWQLATHSSTILAMEKSFYIYLPNASASSRVPVLYLLHGVGGNYTNWMTASHISEQAKKYNMAIILADGGSYSWYVDSPVDSSSRYESYLVQELMPYVEAHYQVRSLPSARAISGLSMGGHGAISLALKHPQLFGAVSSMSGILDLTIHPTMWSGWQLDRVLGAWEVLPQNWHANNCYDLILHSHAALPVLYFDCGLEDHIALQDNQKFARRLDSLHLAYTYRESTGGHRWDYWDQQLDSHLAFFSNYFNANVLVRSTDYAELPLNLAGAPNPFNDSVVLSFELPVPAEIQLDIYNMAGQKVRCLANGYYSSGQHHMPWRNGQVAAGQYLVVLTCGEQRSVIKLAQVR